MPSAKTRSLALAAAATCVLSAAAPAQEFFSIDHGSSPERLVKIDAATGKVTAIGDLQLGSIGNGLIDLTVDNWKTSLHVLLQLSSSHRPKHGQHAMGRHEDTVHRSVIAFIVENP